VLEIKAYIVYCYTILKVPNSMNTDPKSQEIRWQVIKAMLDEFPTLKEKVRDYLNRQEQKQ
jgi:hypothetical protein